MKILLLIIFVSVFGGTVCGQEADILAKLFSRQPVSHWQIGASGGLSVNKIDIYSPYGPDYYFYSANGYTVGATVAYHPLGWLSFHSGVSILQKNWRFVQRPVSVSEVYENCTHNYITTPLTLNVSVGHPISVSVFFGGFMDYWLLERFEGKISNYDIINHNGDAIFREEEYIPDDRYYNRYQFGITYGFALHYRTANKIELSGEMRWLYSLTSQLRSDFPIYIPRYNTAYTITLGLAYWL